MQDQPSSRVGAAAVVPEAVTRLRGLGLRLVAANVAGASLVVLYLWLFLNGPEDDTSAAPAEVVTTVLAIVAVVAVLSVLAYFWGRRISLSGTNWIVEGRPPSSAERVALALAPTRIALMTISFWFVGGIGWGFLSAFIESTAESISSAITVLLGGLVAAALSYLVSERGFREIYALAFALDTPPNVHTIGLRPRFLLAWGLGSAVPLMLIGLLPLWSLILHRDQSRGGVWFLVGVGMVVGVLMTLAVARSVADPVDRVRDTLHDVQSGSLAVAVPVNDAGEIGRLQAGVNQMVEGLRERERLRDLFGRHVGTDVADVAMHSDRALGGETREISALFIDMIGFTTRSEAGQPEDIAATMNAIFSVVVDVVSSEGGLVNKFAGDAALCVFGAPTHQPDHAARVLRAARRLRDGLAALTETEAHTGVDTGIGVSSGAALAGNLGAEQRYEYTVIGDPVNEASRLTELAKQREARVLAAGATVEAAGSEARNWVNTGEVTLRGRSQRTETWEPLDVAAHW